MSTPVIDAHQHVWDPARAAYPWLGPALSPIDTAMSLDDLLPELRAAGVQYTVQVQSSDNAEDTQLMRESAAAHPEVAGIVGYAPLDDPAATARTLDAWALDPLLVGARVLIHNRPDPDWLLRPDVDESLGMLAERGLTFDLVAVLPRHLELVPLLSERHPTLRMVIDHLGHPPVGEESLDPWAGLLTAAAANPLVHAKVSGLYATRGELSSWTPDALRPAVSHALAVFGPSRLMYGGDWPICVLAGGYTRVWQGLNDVLADLDADDRDRVFGGTAADFYRLDIAHRYDV